MTCKLCKKSENSNYGGFCFECFWKTQENQNNSIIREIFEYLVILPAVMVLHLIVWFINLIDQEGQLRVDYEFNKKK